jgi:hypothetical protein
MQQPRGADLLETLIKLLADQEGVKITYEIEEVLEDEPILHRRSCA